MNKLGKFFVIIISVAAAAATIISLILQLKSEESHIEIRQLQLDNLTQLPLDKEINATFYFRDSIICKSLWKYQVKIENIGDETIIGKGIRKSIIDDRLSFLIDERDFNILSIEIDTSSLPIDYFQLENGFEISFLQWKQKEYIVATIYAEKVNPNSSDLKLLLNDRQIINGKVSYGSDKIIVKERQIVANYIPKVIRSILWWFGIIIFVIIEIALPIVAVQEMVNYSKYKNWERQNLNSYNLFMNELLKSGAITEKLKPKELPEFLWSDFKFEIPNIPKNLGEYYNFVIGYILVFIMTTIPLLWMLKI